MTEYASLSEDDVVLDAGAGLGFLTRSLASRCREVLAIEADGRVLEALCENTSDLPNVRIIGGDILRAHVPPFTKAVSIPPYKISTPLLLWLGDRAFDCAVLILQKEFAQRINAAVGTGSYSWLTVIAYYHFQTELLDEVPRSMFYPHPNVDSNIMRLKRRASPPFTLFNEQMFKKLVRALFSQRNRKVRNALRPFLKRESTSSNGLIESDKLDSLPLRDRRVRELAPEELGALANAIYS